MLWKCLNYLKAREETEAWCAPKLIALRAACLFSLNSIHKTELKIQHRKVLWGWIWWLLQSININTECHSMVARERESYVRWRNKVLSLDCFQSATYAFAMQSWGRTPHSATPPYHNGILASASFPLSNKQVQMWKLPLDRVFVELFQVGQDLSLACCHITEGKQRYTLLLRVYMDSKFILASGGLAFSAPSPS